MIARSIFVSLFLAVTLASAGCSKDPSPADAPAKTGGHAAQNVKPGSHEDWCGEHGVPESQCTRCNPALIPAFKATKDWCDEHSMPESQCMKCNPQLKIARPPKGS